MLFDIDVLKNKRILITAGPTWVPIDSARVIGNTATGRTGILLAEGLAGRGGRVTLLLGPVGACCLDKRIKVLDFKFFGELKDKLAKEIKSKKYAIVVHTAAVSDYQPLKHFRGKIKSGRKNLRIALRPTPKIINLIKRIDRNLLLVGFKFEPQAGKINLLSKARKLLAQAKADLVVANNLAGGGYRAYIVGQGQEYGPYGSKAAMVNRLIGLLQWGSKP
ncbi:MAG: phosphopantothenoylcysteine decarboxylase [Candidatus Omnitrophota bacterium]|nr:phosphopantothenoylcysteine decarboxylase [Candidatus Omnitrophota bacterium]